MASTKRQADVNYRDLHIQNLVTRVLWTNRSRWGKFGVLVLVMVLLSLLASLFTRLTILRPERLPFYHIAVLAPTTGDRQIFGQSIVNGAEVAAQLINDAGGLRGNFVAVDVFDSAQGAEAEARNIATNDNIMAVVTGIDEAEAERAAAVFAEAKIPVLSTSGALPRTFNNQWLYSLGYDGDREVEFLANYVRNILGEVLVSTVVDTANHEDDAARFSAAYERFGVPVSHQWQIDSAAGVSDEALRAIVDEIKETTDAGTLYLALDPTTAARLVTMMRSAEVPNKVVGTKDLATRQFNLGFDPAERERFMNGTLVLAPVLLDTTGGDAQIVRSRYVSALGVEPDWNALIAAQAVKALGDAVLRSDAAASGTSVADYREPIRAALAASSALGDHGQPVADLPFNADGVASYPIGVGVYDGENLISALTQLQTIRPSEVDNYIDLVKQGRALYVNDRFMYKTNVVYVGVVVKEVRDFDPLAATFDADFVIWFRYRGDLHAEDILFQNAVTPIELGDPTKTERSGDLNYVSYTVSSKFAANFMSVDRPYGTELYGLSFRHRSLDQNNLRYVVDLVGMGLVGDDSLTDKMNRAKALSPALGQVISRAWISQDIVRTDGLGSLTFVGSGKPAPDFSEITLGAIVASATPSIGETIPSEYLIYILFFAVTGIIFALVMDRRRQGARLFWAAQTWLLYAVCAPLLLISGSTLLLNAAFGRIEFSYLDTLVDIYSSLLWIVPAAILAMAIKRFVWLPLERHSGNKVPGAIQAIVGVLVYSFAIVGVLSNVFGMDVTSLLAASGVFSIVIGLALQNNIANIFSGIVLNLERPFSVGDILLLEDRTEAQVIDITWRSIQLRDSLGIVHSIPNSLATSKQMTRVTSSTGEPYRMRVLVNVSPAHDPELVMRLIKEGLANAEGTLESPKSVWYVGVGQTEFATYGVRFACAEYGDRDRARGAVWTSIWRTLDSAGIEISKLDFSSMSAVANRASMLTTEQVL